MQAEGTPWRQEQRPCCWDGAATSQRAQETCPPWGLCSFRGSVFCLCKRHTWLSDGDRCTRGQHKQERGWCWGVGRVRCEEAPLRRWPRVRDPGQDCWEQRGIPDVCWSWRQQSLLADVGVANKEVEGAWRGHRGGAGAGGRVALGAPLMGLSTVASSVHLSFPLTFSLLTCALLSQEKGGPRVTLFHPHSKKTVWLGMGFWVQVASPPDT